VSGASIAIVDANQSTVSVTATNKLSDLPVTAPVQPFLASPGQVALASCNDIATVMLSGGSGSYVAASSNASVRASVSNNIGSIQRLSPSSALYRSATGATFLKRRWQLSWRRHGIYRWRWLLSWIISPCRVRSPCLGSFRWRRTSALKQPSFLMGKTAPGFGAVFLLYQEHLAISFLACLVKKHSGVSHNRAAISGNISRSRIAHQLRLRCSKFS